MVEEVKPSNDYSNGPDYVGSCESCGCDLTIWDGYQHGDKDLFCETCVQRANRIYGEFDD